MLATSDHPYSFAMGRFLEKILISGILPSSLSLLVAEYCHNGSDEEVVFEMWHRGPYGHELKVYRQHASDHINMLLECMSRGLMIRYSGDSMIRLPTGRDLESFQSVGNIATHLRMNGYSLRNLWSKERSAEGRIHLTKGEMIDIEGSCVLGVASYLHRICVVFASFLVLP